MDTLDTGIELDPNPLLIEQIGLEMEAMGRGQDRFLSSVRKARGRGQETDVGASRSLLRRTVGPFQKAVEDLLKEVEKPTKEATYARYLRMLPAASTALITTKTALGVAGSSQEPLTKLSLSLGSALEDECKVRAFEDAHKGLLKYVESRLQTRTSNDRYRRDAILHTAFRNVGMEWEAWEKEPKVLLGSALLTLWCATTGLATIQTIRRGQSKNQVSMMEIADEALKWIESENQRISLLTPERWPTIIPPQPWSGHEGGGYYMVSGPKLRLVKGGFQGTRQALEERLTPAKCPVVFEAINTLQAVPWKINTAVLNALAEAWGNLRTLGGLPSRELLPLPAKPADIATNEILREAWKREARTVHNDNIKLKSKRLQILRVLELGRKFKDREAIYFPYTLDFRGRAYAVPGLLNPQSFDAARALLHFADGKPITAEKGAYWLAVHVANTFGVDKVSFDERIQWVMENAEQIKRSALSPLENQWWAGADKPWQFLAACFEWAGYLEHGDGFVSRLPIALDGSCNGIQHYSAMLRDEVGGSAVNLVPADRPADIYHTVACGVKERLQDKAEKGDDEASRPAKALLDWGKVDRKITKRPVMVLPYGGTRLSCLDYVRDAVKEKNGDAHFGEQFLPICTFLGGEVWPAIGEVVIAARAAMDWLVNVSRVMTKAKLPLEWVTPSGFPVHMSYPKLEHYRINTVLYGTVIRPRMARETLEIDSRAQSQGVAPNFVHSMDAAAMMLTVREAGDLGVLNLSMIHDSYGTLAAQTDELVMALRGAFVKMYVDHDVLAELLESVLTRLPQKYHKDIPPLPPKGKLDITKVLESDYFFA